ncbi:MAG: hypothetical protein BGO54_19675 [Sphingobacteriales bacterium 46-32]|nr:MAG: hypothetical protein BGO54_19675 [Sphingobacteriales bacterium 46-32]
MRKNNSLLFAGLLLGFAALTGCDKFKPYDTKVVEPEVHFTGARNQLYAMNSNPAPVFNIGVGTTDLSSVDRVITFKMQSLSGATPGTEFTIGTTNNTVTIPAGQAVAYIPIQGNAAYYGSGEKDTLLFTLEQTGVKIAGFQDTVRLVLRGPCFDGVDIGDAATLDAQKGAYAKSFDAGFGAYGPYLTTIKSITPLTATTARAVINNVWDDNFGDLNFLIDWTNPANVTINLEGVVVTGGNAGNLNSAYNGMNLVIRQYPGLNGQFSVCTGIHTLRYQLGVYNPATQTILGFFSNIGVTTIEK